MSGDGLARVIPLVVPLAQDDPDDHIWAKSDAKVRPAMVFHYTYRQRGKQGQRRVYKPWHPKAGQWHDQPLTGQHLSALAWLAAHGACAADVFQQAAVSAWMRRHPGADKAKVANKLASRISELCAMGPCERPDLRLLRIVGSDEAGQFVYDLTEFGWMVYSYALNGWAYHDDDRLWEAW